MSEKRINLTKCRKEPMIQRTTRTNMPLAINCPHCKFEWQADDAICPVCGENILDESPRPNAIYDRVFALMDEVEKYRAALEVVAKQKYCTGCNATKAIANARILVQIRRRQ